jgi:hypothetical protein
MVDYFASDKKNVGKNRANGSHRRRTGHPPAYPVQAEINFKGWATRLSQKRAPPATTDIFQISLLVIQ